MSVAHLVTDGVGEARELHQRRLLMAHRLAAAVATREATVGPVISTAELGLFPQTGLELRDTPRRACVSDTCVEVNPRERCIGEDCSRRCPGA